MLARKFLIIGAQGLIGEHAIAEIDSRYPWQGTYFRRPTEGKNFIYCDITDKNNLKEVFKEVQPTHVIHGANLAGGVLFCEKNPDIARKVHLQGTMNVGELCQARGVKFIYPSTECVFDGADDQLYKEDSPCHPLNIYGKCKRESEMWIQGHLKEFIIVRTMSVFGWQPETISPNALMSAYFAISKKEKLSVPTFRWTTPTYVRDLAKAIVELGLSGTKGIFHVVGESYLNRYEWLKKTCDFLGWDSSWLVAQDSPSKNSVPYPAKVRLNTEKFHAQCQTPLNTLEQALVLLRKDISCSQRIN